MRYITIIVLFLTALTSCTKVINVNLNDATEKYMVSANISDAPGPYKVSITRSINFDQTNNFPNVQNAVVIISDVTTSLTDTLSIDAQGNYWTHTIAGTQGHTYALQILVDNQVFTASSTIPTAVTLDSIYTTGALIGDGTNIVQLYRDPAGIKNYYHSLLKIHDSLSEQIYLYNDEISDGTSIEQTLRNRITIHPGDSIIVEFQCIDEATYRYYSTLQQTVQQNSATPANPQSNISGGALGYFSAHTVQHRSIIAP